MKRHQLWREEYRWRRYLQHVTPEQLAQRLRDMMNNLSTLTFDAKIGPLPVGPVGEFWMIRLTHVFEEYALRGEGIPSDAMREHLLPEARWPRQGRSSDGGAGV